MSISILQKALLLDHLVEELSEEEKDHIIKSFINDKWEKNPSILKENWNNYVTNLNMKHLVQSEFNFMQGELNANSN